MAYQKVTHTSWFSRIGRSFGGVLTGLILIVLASWLLYWNEGRTVKTGGAIGEAQMLTVRMKDISKVDSSFDGKLVHASGRAETEKILQDLSFGVEKQAIKLARKVEYYQWVESSRSETRKKLGGGEETVTTYTYDLKWSNRPVDSSVFEDPLYRNRNTVLTTVEDDSIVASEVTFGAYTLPSFLVNGIGGARALPVELSAEKKEEIAKLLGEGKGADFVHSRDNTIYLGGNPNSPRVGDLRVSFTETPPADISIVARVIGSTFEQFVASNGYTFSRIDMGTVSPETMFEDAKTANTVMAWALRAVGTILVIAGLSLVFAPLSVIADFIPLLGTIVGAGTGLVAFLLGLAWSLLLIAIAWIRFRPLLAGGLIAAVVAILALLYMKGRGKKAAGGSAA
ncbi:MAG: TMEM43 family protein [Aminivibrio sp.]